MDGMRMKTRGTRKKILIFTGRTDPDLAGRTARRLGVKVGRCRIENFPDGELQVEIQNQVRSRLDCRPPFILAASHGLFAGDAREKLSSLPIRKLFVSDSVQRPPAFPFPLRVLSLDRLLAAAIQRL